MSRPYLTLWFGGFLPHISTYAMCVLIDWTWLNNVCLQLIRRPHRLRFTSRSFRAERALQLLAVPVETDLAILISDFADFSALLPQVSNLNSSSSHLVSFHGCCGHWKSDSHNQENRMCHENPLHHVYIVRLIFGANDSCSVQGCRLLSQWILQVRLSWTKHTAQEELCHLARFAISLAALALTCKAVSQNIFRPKHCKFIKRLYGSTW